MPYIPKIPKIEVSDDSKKTLKIVAIIAGLFFLGKKAFGSAAKNAADSQLDTDPAAGQARALNAAMNPSGNNWMRHFDGTNTDAIWEIAKQITNLDKVREFYAAQHENDRDFNDDLEREIGAEGFQKFLAIATKGKTGNIKYSPVRNDIPANKWVITTSEANVRKSPKLEKVFNPFNPLLPVNPFTNIVKKVEKGKVLGVSTGKFTYDEKNDVTYIEFYTLGSKKAGKLYFFVAKSQVELLTNEEKQKREKTGGKFPLELLDGLSGADQDETTQAVSLRATVVYDEHFKPLLIASKNIILGFPIMNLNTGKRNYIKIKTIQEKFRWVDARDIKIEKR